MEAAADGPRRIFDTRCGGELYVANLISWYPQANYHQW